MKFTKKVMFGGSAVFAIAAIAAVALSMFAPASDVAAARQEQCVGDDKIEGTSAYFTAPDGKGIEYVCIKAGTQLFTFPCGDDGDE